LQSEIQTSQWHRFAPTDIKKQAHWPDNFLKNAPKTER